MVADFHFGIPGVHEDLLGLDIDGLNSCLFACETR